MALGVPPALARDWAIQREAMVAEIRADVIATRAYIGRGSLQSGVLAVLGRVPRHAFVPDAVRPSAYANRPLPIGHGQTISQPYIVALMTDLLEPGPEDTILEVGTGSGYQAAVLAELAGRIHTIEIIPELARQAEVRFKRLGYDRIQVRQGDGYFGWPDAGPFDGIIVTAAADHVPPPLVRQLKKGGRMVIPVGHRFSVQQLLLITKDREGKLKTRQILPVRFVPLTGDH
ncbi:MAG: protein-L-isoaspartate(D-aspartate) O-methyltransferase [Desulfosarcina sp.]|nr:protein-L-isoaspartate(D-aspartate) O-methyltransferase [Desulfobacterales bacterium]